MFIRNCNNSFETLLQYIINKIQLFFSKLPNKNIAILLFTTNENIIWKSHFFININKHNISCIHFDFSPYRLNHIVLNLDCIYLIGSYYNWSEIENND